LSVSNVDGEADAGPCVAEGADVPVAAGAAASQAEGTAMSNSASENLRVVCILLGAAASRVYASSAIG
jgi:hypothetical protein